MIRHTYIAWVHAYPCLFADFVSHKVDSGTLLPHQTHDNDQSGLLVDPKLGEGCTTNCLNCYCFNLLPPWEGRGPVGVENLLYFGRFWGLLLQLTV